MSKKIKKVLLTKVVSAILIFVFFQSCDGCHREAYESDRDGDGQLDSTQFEPNSPEDLFDRMDIDTTSTTSPAAKAKSAAARSIQQELIRTLPKFTIKTGTGENEINRTYYVVEGDLRLDREELYFYSLKRLLVKDTSGEQLRNNKLSVATDTTGRPAIWPQRAILHYTVKRSSFATKALYDSAVRYMRVATADWMKVCNIRFVYLSDLDKNDDVDPGLESARKLFIVRQFDANGKWIAQGFYPSDPEYERMILLDNTFFTSKYSMPGVLRHELGHVLGFRHEHIWSPDASCSGEKVFEGTMGAKPKTQYDPYSVMHYPCGLNADNTKIELTQFDIEGARKIYPFRL